MKQNDVIEVRVQSSSEGEELEDLTKKLVVGKGYLHKAIDESFKKHKVGDSYKIDLSVDEAYGKRQRELMRMIPSRYFKKNNVNPRKGLVVNVDGVLGKVASASPGRVLVDFNHPLAGKPVTYKITIKKKVKDKMEKVKTVVSLSLGQELEVSKDGENIVIKDSIGLPENIKKRVETEIISVIGKANIKFISEK